MSTAVSDARTRLYDAVVAELAEFPWRVHRVTPAQIAAPTVYLDSVELFVDRSTGPGLIVATFPVVMIVDGTVRAQVEALDDLVARVWSALLGIGADPTDARPYALDVGGPSLRAQGVRADVMLQALTLCAPTLVSASNGGTP